jgi:GAF domain-containing protein
MADEPTLESPSLQPHEAFAELAMIMLGTEPLTAVLQRVADLAVRTIPAIDEASITVMENGKARTAAFTGSLALDLDERQYETGFGPCLDAGASGQTILVDTQDEHSPYPLFTEACRHAGVHHTLSTGLPTTKRLMGGLNLYARSEQPIKDSSIELAERFAGYAAVAVANLALHASTAALVTQLQTAMASRAVIEQAKGLIMGQQHCTEQEAFEVLVRASQHQNRKLRDIAADLVTGSQR